MNHASSLIICIQQSLKHAGIEGHDLDAISVSAGPGSYTGLRIGAVTAKGLCFAWDKPLIAVDSLLVLALGLSEKYPSENFTYCPTIDARRDEIYFALFNSDLQVIIPSKNIILSPGLPFQILPGRKVVIGGGAVEKCRLFWQDPSLIFDTSLTLSSRFMIAPAEEKFSRRLFENPASFEPNYIKPVFISAARKT